MTTIFSSTKSSNNNRSSNILNSSISSIDTNDLLPHHLREYDPTDRNINNNNVINSNNHDLDSLSNSISGTASSTVAPYTTIFNNSTALNNNTNKINNLKTTNSSNDNNNSKIIKNINNDSSSTSNSNSFKIIKAFSSFNIKQINQQNDLTKDDSKTNYNKNSNNNLNNVIMNKKNKNIDMSTSLVETTAQNNSYNNTSSSTTSNASKLRLPSFKKLKSKLSIRKSHSTASSLSDILLNKSTNLSSVTNSSNKKMSNSNTSNNINNISNKNNIDKLILINSSNHDNNNENLYYQSLPLPYNKLNNGYYNGNGTYIDVIQEEQQITSNNLIDSISNIQLHNDLNTYTKSNASSSSSSSLNNNNNSNFNLNNHSNVKLANYSNNSTSTNTTATSNSLNNHEYTPKSTSSPHNINNNNNILNINNQIYDDITKEQTKSNNGGITGFLSSLSSSFSSSSSQNNNNNSNTNNNENLQTSNNNVKLRLNKTKLKNEIQKRISLPANILNNHPLVMEQKEKMLNNTGNNYYNIQTPPPLIETDEALNEINSTNNNPVLNNKTNQNLIFNNNVNNGSKNFSNYNLLKTKFSGFNSNHQLNQYANNKINNITNGQTNEPLNHNHHHIQSYQSLSSMAMNGQKNNIKNDPSLTLLKLKPLSRNSRRASMSELGYGKIESYNKLDKLGEGTYATVFKGQSTINGSFVALKEIRLEHEEGAPCTAIREVSLLKQLKHANIVTLHDIIYTDKSLTLVFEYLEKDLKQYMDDCNNIMSIKNVKLFLFQLLRGLAYCHAKHILHRDLKPQNLLINQKGELKLADFGLARAKSIPTKTYSNEVVTLWYRPPDVLLGSTDYSTHIDMWGVGCIFYEMVCGKPLFPGTKVEDELYLIFKTLGSPNEQTFPGITTNSEFIALNLPKFPLYDPSNFFALAPRLESDGVNLLSSFLKYDPKLRTSAPESIRHSFFSSLPPAIYKLEHNQSIFEVPGVILSSNPGTKLNNAGIIRSSTSSFYKF